MVSLTDRPLTNKSATVTTVAALWIALALIDLDAASCREPASNSAPSGSLLDEIRQHDNGVAIWWTGHNGWLIKSDGLLIGTDLVLDDPSREHASPISAAAP